MIFENMDKLSLFKFDLPHENFWITEDDNLFSNGKSIFWEAFAAPRDFKKYIV